MARRKVELTESFLVEHDDGERTIVDCYTTFTEFVPLETGVGEWKPGAKSLKMRNGHHVNMLGDGELEDVNTGRRYRRITG